MARKIILLTIDLDPQKNIINIILLAEEVVMFKKTNKSFINSFYSLGKNKNVISIIMPKDRPNDIVITIEGLRNNNHHAQITGINAKQEVYFDEINPKKLAKFNKNANVTSKYCTMDEVLALVSTIKQEVDKKKTKDKDVVDWALRILKSIDWNIASKMVGSAAQIGSKGLTSF